MAALYAAGGAGGHRRLDVESRVPPRHAAAASGGRVRRRTHVRPAQARAASTSSTAASGRPRGSMRSVRTS